MHTYKIWTQIHPIFIFGEDVKIIKLSTQFLVSNKSSLNEMRKKWYKLFVKNMF